MLAELCPTAEGLLPVCIVPLAQLGIQVGARAAGVVGEDGRIGADFGWVVGPKLNGDPCQRARDRDLVRLDEVEARWVARSRRSELPETMPGGRKP